jgi:hypothetical protein
VILDLVDLNVLSIVDDRTISSPIAVVDGNWFRDQVIDHPIDQHFVHQIKKSPNLEIDHEITTSQDHKILPAAQTITRRAVGLPAPTPADCPSPRASRHRPRSRCLRAHAQSRATIDGARSLAAEKSPQGNSMAFVLARPTFGSDCMRLQTMAKTPGNVSYDMPTMDFSFLIGRGIEISNFTI